eukprot:g3709.t1
MASVDDDIYMAKLAEQAERYDEMRESMKKVAESSDEDSKIMTIECRNLFSVAYKNVVGAKRASWRIMDSIAAHNKKNGEADKQAAVETYRKKVETELEEICNEVIELLTRKLIQKEPATADDKEANVFFLKMLGDYYRYMAEVVRDTKQEDARAEAEKAYQQAETAAKASLQPTHPIRLGLALNFSVFHFEILDNPQEACTLAKEAFDEAIAELDTLSEESYK